MVVPHCGSKTINVRLTVSPDSKTKLNKSTNQHSRKHRYKPRKIIQSDDEEDSECPTPPPAPPPHHSCQPSSERKAAQRVPSTGAQSSTKSERKINLYISENQSDSNRSSKDCLDKEMASVTNAAELQQSTQRLTPCCDGKTTPAPQDNTKKLTNDCQYSVSNSNNVSSAHQENVYEKLSNFKCCPIKSNIRIVETKADLIGGGCRECELEYPLVDVSLPVQQTATPIASKSNVKKFIRKSRSKKQKSFTHGTDGCGPMPRVRSLSVGNENCYRNGNISKATGDGGDDCLNNLRRNDLIDIIRESMEKNRLCFQPSG